MNRILRSFVTVTVVAAGILGANAIISASTDGQVSLLKLVPKRLAAKVAGEQITVKPVSALDANTLRLVVGTTGNVSYTPADLEASSTNEEIITVGKTGNYTAIAAGEAAIKIGEDYSIPVFVKEAPADEAVNKVVADSLEKTVANWKELNKTMATLTADNLPVVTELTDAYKADLGDITDEVKQEINDYLEYVAYEIVPGYNEELKSVNNLNLYYSTEADQKTPELEKALGDIQKEIDNCQAETNKKIAEIIKKYYNEVAYNKVKVALTDLQKTYNNACYGKDVDEVLTTKDRNPQAITNIYSDPNSIVAGVSHVYDAPSSVVTGKRSLFDSTPYFDFNHVANIQDSISLGKSYAERDYNQVNALDTYKAYLKTCEAEKKDIATWVEAVKKATIAFLSDRNFTKVKGAASTTNSKLATVNATLAASPASIQEAFAGEVAKVQAKIDAIEDRATKPNDTDENGKACIDSTEIVVNTTGEWAGMTKANEFIARLQAIQVEIDNLAAAIQAKQDVYDANVAAYKDMTARYEELRANWEHYYTLINTELITDKDINKAAFKAINAVIPVMDAINVDIKNNVNLDNTAKDTPDYLGVLYITAYNVNTTNTDTESIKARIEAANAQIKAAYITALDATNAKVQAINDAAFKVVQDSLEKINDCYKANINDIQKLKYHEALVNEYLEKLFATYKVVTKPYDEAYARYKEINDANAKLAAADSQMVNYYDNTWVNGNPWVANACDEINAVVADFYAKAKAEDVTEYNDVVAKAVSANSNKFDVVSELFRNTTMIEDENYVYTKEIAERLVEAQKVIVDVDKVSQNIIGDTCTHHNYNTPGCEFEYWLENAKQALENNTETLADIATDIVLYDKIYCNEKAYKAMMAQNSELQTTLADKTKNFKAMYNQVVADLRSDIVADVTDIKKSYDDMTAVDYQPEYQPIYNDEKAAIETLVTNVNNNEEAHDAATTQLDLVKALYKAALVEWNNTENVDPSIVKNHSSEISQIATDIAAVEKKIAEDYVDFWTLDANYESIVTDLGDICTKMNDLDETIEKEQIALEAKTTAAVQDKYSQLKRAWVVYYGKTDGATPMVDLDGTPSTARDLYNKVCDLENVKVGDTEYVIADGDRAETETHTAANHAIWYNSKNLISQFNNYLALVGVTDGDLDGDGVVTSGDIVKCIDCIGGEYNAAADLNGDGEVNSADIVLLINNIK